MIGTYKTKTKLKAVVTQYAPRVKQYFGYVILNGTEKETLWNSEGMNLENPDWDLELANATAPSESPET